jgi:hypothetical protein
MAIHAPQIELKKTQTQVWLICAHCHFSKLVCIEESSYSASFWMQTDETYRFCELGIKFRIYNGSDPCLHDRFSQSARSHVYQNWNHVLLPNLVILHDEL